MMKIDGLLTEKEAAEALGVECSTLRNWRSRRIGPPRIKIGRKAHYRMDAINAWIKSRETDFSIKRKGR